MSVETMTQPLRHTDPGLSQRIAESALARDGGVMRDNQFWQWLRERRQHQLQRVTRVPFAELRDWRFRPDTGNLCHSSGRFFSVEGLRVSTDFGPVSKWTQPIINQPEIGILGIAVREIDGVLHFLMQAKIEPGNINGVQLAPTVQATKSNYTRVHRGAAVPYLETFRDPPPDRVITDVLQSEQGAWFYRKRNRNMVVEVGPEIEAGEDFCWLTLGQLYRLLRVDNLVSMDARTVLSCLPYIPSVGTHKPLGAAIARSADWSTGGLCTTSEILSWITARQTAQELTVLPIPLREVDGWRCDPWAISHELGLYFSVIAVQVESNRREVTKWSQPLLAPCGLGMVAFLVKRFEGVLHVLVNARVEPGYMDTVELAPTVQATPSNYVHLAPENRPPFLDVVLCSRPEQILFDVELAEEGGRFHHAQCRYVIVEVDDDFPEQVRPEFRWMTLHQLSRLLMHSHYLNVQARTLVACLRGLA
ncbi:MAG: NDP-hexose 2,3-dehydratase family protein [Micromonosporaceae bacterium]|nr:NDP-hexose 2,3-dehydratase family protein [Micromonosporaceae bacterium]